MNTPTVLGPYPLYDYDDILFARADGIIYPLTPCCEASATGTDDGTACRECYTLIDSIFGMCWTLEQWRTEFPDRLIR